MRVIGVGVVPTIGMRKGGVVSLEDVTASIMAAKDKAERTSGYEITSALVNVSGSQISSQNSNGMAGVSGQTVGRDDVLRAVEAARSIALPYNRSILHVIPRGYVVDGQDGIKSALGMHGYRLEVEAHVITVGETALANLDKCIEKAGIAVDGWVLSSLAAGEAVLTETEREMGVVVCDIGGGTCDLAVYIEGSVWHTAVIPVGGDHLTNDIAQGLHLPVEIADSAKRRHGQASAAAIDEEQSFTVRAFGEQQPVQISQANLAAIIEPRVEEIFGLIRQEIKRSGYDGLLPAGVVVTGGTSLLPGLKEVGNSVLELPVRTGQPDELRGLVDQLRSPAFATSIGLQHWAHMQDLNDSMSSFGPGRLSWSFSGLRRIAADMFKRILPG